MPYESRRLPIGAEVLRDAVDFRVWAPCCHSLRVRFPNGEVPELPLLAQENGYFHGRSSDARPGMRYGLLLNDDPTLYPDPVSRFQPEGPHAPSEIIDSSAFAWTDADWPGIGATGQVLYEMHVGTFTAEGTFGAIIRQLDYLRETGITCIEMMPVAEFTGRFNWGYDGVDLFAPSHHYGRPDDLRALIDAAHCAGIGVILDVVYNHFGPSGNYIERFAPQFYSTTHHTDWGKAINFDAEGSAGVREFYLANVVHWIKEYHFDGFRFDATHVIIDESPEHILAAIARVARPAAAPRRVYLICENESQQPRIARPRECGGYGMDALWNDDFHHSAMVALSGRNEAYYSDYLASPQEFISAAKYGYLFQGQHYRWQQKRRGEPGFDLPPTAFVHYLQNHDQVANYGMGLRAHQLSSLATFKAITALLLLLPQTPMLLQGQEYAADNPFLYFVDHQQTLNEMIRKGRAEEMSQFPSIAQPEMQAWLPNPSDPETLKRTKLNLEDRTDGQHAWIYNLHVDLLRLRREDPILRRAQLARTIDGAVLGERSFVMRFFGEGGDDRLLLINLGFDLHLHVVPEPLLAPPEAKVWRTIWSSEHPKYGGHGTPPLETQGKDWRLPGEIWRLPGRTANLMAPADPEPPTRE